MNISWSSECIHFFIPLCSWFLFLLIVGLSLYLNYILLDHCFLTRGACVPWGASCPLWRWQTDRRTCHIVLDFTVKLKQMFSFYSCSVCWVTKLTDLNSCCCCCGFEKCIGDRKWCELQQWRTERGVLGCSTPPPEIPKISAESSIAWARRAGISISFCSSLCSHTVVIY